MYFVSSCIIICYALFEVKIWMNANILGPSSLKSGDIK